MNIFSDNQWYIIAKNEYRITINSISPDIKKYFIPFLIVFVLFYPTILTPWLLTTLFDIKTLRLTAQVTIHFYDVFLLNFFLWLLTMPIGLSLKDVKTGYIELLLSTPTKSSDVVLGEFLGKLPFYLFVIVLMSGLMTGVYMVTGTNPIIVVILTLLFVLNFLIAYWIGTNLGFYLKSQAAKSARMKDLGKALSFLLIIPLVFVMYATMGLVLNYFDLDYLAFDLSKLIFIFPSSWIAYISNHLISIQIINNLQNFDFLYYVTITIIFIMIAIYLGNKLTNSIYNLEPSSFSQSVVSPHNFSYKFLKFLGGNGYIGISLAYNYKNYIRRFENLSKLVYSVCLMFMMIIFFNNMTLDLEFAYIIAIVFSALLSGFIISEMTMQGKEKLILYKQTPTHEWNFIISKLIFYLIIIIPIVFLFNILTAFLIAEFYLNVYLMNLILILFTSLSLIMVSTGIYITNPPFTDRSPEFIMNFQIILFLSIFSFFMMLIFIKDLSILGKDFVKFTFLDIQIIHGILIFLTGLMLLILGKKKLESLE